MDGECTMMYWRSGHSQGRHQETQISTDHAEAESFSFSLSSFMKKEKQELQHFLEPDPVSLH